MISSLLWSGSVYAVTPEEAESAAQAIENRKEENTAMKEMASESEVIESQTESESTRSGVTITKSSEITATESNDGIRGGTNQDDAILLPINTILHGHITGEESQWFAFTTTSGEDITYWVTAINKTIGHGDLLINLCDDYGNNHLDAQFGELKANDFGRATTANLKDTEQDTTYYVRVSSKSRKSLDYTLKIGLSGVTYDGFSTTSDTIDLEQYADITSGIPGRNQEDALLIPVNAEVKGTLPKNQPDANIAWFAFTTNDDEDAYYSVTVINRSPDHGEYMVTGCDEFGNRKLEAQFNELKAPTDGKAVTSAVQETKPNRTYYVAVYSKSSDKTHDYTVIINGPEEKAEEEPVVVFEKPFELTEQQVMFIADSDEFVDRNAAIQALKPVADVILQYPEQPILLAGTTATFGEQAGAVALSEKRAAAVKNLLVTEFGIPEKQLLTKGLGFSADPFVRGKDIDGSGNFVETEAAKNRRVVVVNAESDIAKGILGTAN